MKSQDNVVREFSWREERGAPKNPPPFLMKVQLPIVTGTQVPYRVKMKEKTARKMPPINFPTNHNLIKTSNKIVTQIAH